MAIEDALMEISGNMTYAPASAFHDVMDSAPLLHDLDSGRLAVIADRESADAIILTRREAATMLDLLQEFQMGYASDGHGNSVPVPVTAYQRTPSFREKWPRLYRAGRIALLATGVLLAGAAMAGCVSDSNGHKITDKTYGVGSDGSYGTDDDYILFEMSGHWYKVDSASIANVSNFNRQVGVGDFIYFDHYKAGGTDGTREHPYVVSEVQKYTAPEKIKADGARDARESELEWQKNGGIVFGSFFALAACLTLLIGRNKIGEYFKDRARTRKEKRRNKNR